MTSGANGPFLLPPPVALGFPAFMPADNVQGMTKLVIVDDHEALREGLAALLQSRGMEILGAAGNVAAGLDLVEHAVPDIALVDIRLPDGSGIELTRQLIARRPELGVILYTGDSDA